MAELLADRPLIESVFATDGPVAYVCDDDDVVAWLANAGHWSMTWHDALSTTGLDAVILIACDYGRAGGEALAAAKRSFGDAKVLWVPLACFDASFEAATYTLRLLLASDPGRAVNRNRAWHDLYAADPGPFRFRGPGTDLTCELSERLTLATRLPLALDRGEWEGVGTFFEVNVEHDRTGVAFEVNGVLTVDGVLAARHHGMDRVGRGRFQAASELVEHLSGSGEAVTVEVADTHVRTCWAGDEDVTDLLRQVTNPDHQGRCGEYAVGTNHEIRPALDWSMNSQLNEGIQGVHLGVGDGRTGAHVDFISSSARLALPDSTIEINPTDPTDRWMTDP